MTGKAKPKKHTAKEIAAKIDAATTNRGGGKAGLHDRTGKEKGGHAKFECPHCKTTAPDLKSMQIHHDARHPKIPFEEDKLVNLHQSSGGDSSKPRPSSDSSKPRPSSDSSKPRPCSDSSKPGPVGDSSKPGPGGDSFKPRPGVRGSFKK